MASRATTSAETRETPKRPRESSDADPPKRPRESSDADPPKRPREAAPAAPTPPAAPSDEIIAAAPKLAAAIRSAAKAERVAEKVASLFEEGLVKPFNAGALFGVLSAAIEDPARWRKPSNRGAFRKLFSAAASRPVLFSLPQQQQIKVWRLRVVTQIDLLSSAPEGGFLEVATLLRRLPCDDPENEPRSTAQPGYSHLLSGARTDYLPERTRGAWCDALLECLDVAVSRFAGPHLWARPEVNTLVKLAAERRRCFTRPQQEVLDGWEGQRQAHPATRALDYAKHLQDKPVL